MEFNSWTIILGLLETISIFVPKAPVAIIVTLMFSSRFLSSPTPIIISTSPPASFCIWVLISPISSKVISSFPDIKSKRTFSAPLIVFKFNKGESNAFFIAVIALSWPLALAEPIIAVPLFLRTVLASFKSIFTWALTVMTSEIPLAATVKTSSDFANPVLKPNFPYISINLSLLITIKESTCFFIFSIPSWACCILFFPSKENGTVTIAIVSISNSWAFWAIIGAAPVPVPPPIPAVIKTILVPCFKMLFISSILSNAEFSPTSGSSPAPKPSVNFTPSCIWLGIRLLSIAWASVLQITKSTPWIPCSNI